MRRCLSITCLALLLGGIVSVAAWAQEPAVWSVEHYGELSERMDAADRAQAALPPGTPEWLAAGGEALDAREVLLSWVTEVLEAGSVPEELVADAVRARFLLLQNIVVMAAEQGRCEGLIERSAALVVPADDDGELAAARERALHAASTCVVPAPPVVEAEMSSPDASESAAGEGAATESTGSTVAGAPEQVGAASAPGPGAPEPEAGTPGARRAGWALVGVGATAFVGGWAWDAASAAGPRREFRALSDDCDAGQTCDMDRLRALRRTIDGSRVPIASLVAGGAAIAVAGTSMLVLERRRERRDNSALAVLPGTASTWSGATLELRW